MLAHPRFVIPASLRHSREGGNPFERCGEVGDVLGGLNALPPSRGRREFGVTAIGSFSSRKVKKAHC